MIVPLTLLDCVSVAHHLRERDWWAIRALVGNLEPDQIASALFATQGPAWSILEDGKPAVILGLDREKDGVARWWLMADRRVRLKNYARTIVRFGRNAVDDAFREGGIHRVQAIVLEEWPEAVRLAEAIGLQHEGRLRHYGNHGEHVLMLARTHGKTGQESRRRNTDSEVAAPAVEGEQVRPGQHADPAAAKR